MSDKIKQEGQNFARFLKSLPAKVKAAGNKKSMDEAVAEHQDFSDKFKAGICYLCSRSLSSFEKTSPCLHWLLMPNGFKKGDFPAVTKKFGCIQLQSYLRWVANEDVFAENINDLKEEGTSNKIIELTIKYRDFKWSFSCSESDYKGHGNARDGKHPHYHFQLRRLDWPIIRYNDFHVPLSDRDIVMIEAARAAPDSIVQHFPFGEGMGDVLTDETVEHIVRHTEPTDDFDGAQFHIQTIVMADEGTTISGEDLQAIFEEAKAKNVTVASLMGRLSNARVQTLVTPGPGVVEQAPRTGRGKGKREGE